MLIVWIGLWNRFSANSQYFGQFVVVLWGSILIIICSFVESEVFFEMQVFLFISKRFTQKTLCQRCLWSGIIIRPVHSISSMVIDDRPHLHTITWNESFRFVLQFSVVWGNSPTTRLSLVWKAEAKSILYSKVLPVLYSNLDEIRYIFHDGFRSAFVEGTAATTTPSCGDRKSIGGSNRRWCANSSCENRLVEPFFLFCLCPKRRRGWQNEIKGETNLSPFHI